MFHRSFLGDLWSVYSSAGVLHLWLHDLLDNENVSCVGIMVLTVSSCKGFFFPSVMPIHSKVMPYRSLGNGAP